MDGQGAACQTSTQNPEHQCSAGLEPTMLCRQCRTAPANTRIRCWHGGNCRFLLAGWCRYWHPPEQIRAAENLTGTPSISGKPAHHTAQALLYPPRSGGNEFYDCDELDRGLEKLDATVDSMNTQLQNLSETVLGLCGRLAVQEEQRDLLCKWQGDAQAQLDSFCLVLPDVALLKQRVDRHDKSGLAPEFETFV